MTKLTTIKSYTLASALGAAAMTAVVAFGNPAPASAQQGQGILGGAIIGGAIGGAVKGKKGILPGAIIGGVVGGVANSQARRPPPPPRYYGQPRPYPRPVQPVYNNGLVYNIQSSLTRLGYNPGPVDGVYGQRTAEAISAYEYNNRLPVTGTPSQSVLYHMQRAGG